MTPVSSALPALLDAALQYAADGFPVFPCHSAKGVRCSCPRNGCKSPGKHPRINNWGNEATTDPDKIRAWWKSWPDSNIGIPAGHGLLVLDIDPGNGGEDSFSDLISHHGTLPVTPESVTGTGGRHLLFRYDGELRNSVQGIAPGVDIRADGGLFIAPPSIHATGRQYEWASGRALGEVPIAPIPQWLLTLVRALAAKRTRRIDPDDPIPDGSRNDTLTSLAGVMRRKGFGEGAILAALLDTNAQRCTPPLDEVEVKTIVSSIMRYRPGTWSGQVRPDGTPDVAGRLQADGTPAAPPTVAPGDGNWEMELVYDHKMRVKGTVPGNAALLLTNLPEWKGCLQFDAFNNRIDWMREAPPVEGLQRPSGEFVDHHVLYVQQWLAKYRNVEFAKGSTQDAIISAARNNWVHPLQDYLNSLVWDGVPRLSRWLTTYLGSEHTPYTKAVGEWWAISAVARAMKPGCQVDHMLILEGVQGCGKSTAARILAGEWFLGSLPDLRNLERAADALNGHWIVEMGELDAMRGSTMTRTKNFLTQPTDTYRAAYARFKETHRRSCVFIGTTNEANYLRDATGARRFWPVRVKRLNRKELIVDRDKLWAEALYLYHNGAEWHPSQEHVSLLKAEQDERYETDPWEELIGDWLEDPSIETPILTSGKIAQGALKLDAARYDHGVASRIGRCMQRLGYVHTEPMKDDERKSVRVWVRLAPLSTSLQSDPPV